MNPDDRFARLKTDPRFRRPRKHKSQVVLDERFSSVLKQAKKGEKKKQVDKYGCTVSRNRDKNDVNRFYRLEEERSERPDYARGAVLLESSDEEDEEEPDSDDGHYVALGKEALVNEEEEINLDEEDLADLDAQAAAYQEEYTQTNRGRPAAAHTRRLAIVNLDWDHVKAAHLLKICSSVTKAGPSAQAAETGRVLSVRVYPSDFGKERIAREEKEGPPKEIFQKRDSENEVFQVGEEDEYDNEALRKYQLERMRYFYAVLECDSTRTATQIYEELDGTELESTANIFDLSFVPDDMTFMDEFREEATENDLASDFRPLDFTTEALQHSKVRLTWDEDDPDRNRLTRRTLTKKEIDEGNFDNILASASSESEDETKSAASRTALRALLLDKQTELPEGWRIEDDDPRDLDMEVTFQAGLSEPSKDETTIDRYQRKLKERRQKRKEGQKKADVAEDEFFDVDSAEGRPVANMEELSLLASGGKEHGHFNMQAILKSEKQKKHRKKQVNAEDDELQDTFAIDVSDERFKAVHEDHNFAIDPSNPYFKKTTAMAKLLEERGRRQTKRKSFERGSEEQLTALVDKIKKRKVD